MNQFSFVKSGVNIQKDLFSFYSYHIECSDRMSAGWYRRGGVVYCTIHYLPTTVYLLLHLNFWTCVCRKKWVPPLPFTYSLPVHTPYRTGNSTSYLPGMYHYQAPKPYFWILSTKVLKLLWIRIVMIIKIKYCSQVVL